MIQVGLDKQLENWIKSGIANDDRYTTEEIISGLQSGKFQLFRYPQGIVVTQITGHNRLLVFLLSGDNFDSWKAEANEDLMAFAHIRGIGVIEAYARPGLEKSLRELGWIKTQIVLRLRTKTRSAQRCQGISSANEPTQ